MKKRLHKLKNFYVATGLGLLVWMFFLDSNDIISQIRNARKLSDLEDDRAYLKEEITSVQKKRKEVFGSARSKEKFARENYLMRKPGETVYVLMNEHNEPIEK
ncbi:FtsB family cell division protein [Tellurirhabdus rosea]|uniref:FtsB family cell division protein n=1 Tax=Tellurirhabdus rosea TaxID=2674997 RepID=UPI00224E3D2D|nr:septum formation initiator family protein [Tellurirhabdus rosea]